jgi:acyl carrier protein
MTAKTMTREETLLWLAEIFEESPDYIQPDRLREDIPTWDSVGVLNLIAGVDEKFGVIFSDKEIRAMTKVGDILTLLEQKGKLN